VKNKEWGVVVKYRTEQELTALAERLIKEIWGLEELTIPIIINPRMKRWFGMFRWAYVRDSDKKVIGRKPKSIHVSTFAIDNFSDLAIEDLMKHELCHYYCCLMKKPQKDVRSSLKLK